MSDEVLRAARIALKGIRLALHRSAIRAADMRSIEIYLLVTACGVNSTSAAEVCGCSKQNVSKLVGAVETRREDRNYDKALAELERAIMGE
ncbi:hypothetical protein ACRQ1B_06145 [Rhizobium panacihumi]|uniref:hypothetical protein n=1 Tax=Rhizobium panacihumi TaxID=2008450 RepID=UPI003D7A178A